MKTINAQEALADGFDVASLPAPGPDGALHMPPRAQPIAEAPRLCELGPCRNYHRIVHQIAGQDYEDGTEALAVQTLHTCYPGVGIEVELSETPVLECNRWTPMDDEDPAHKNLVTLRRHALESNLGYRFQNDLHKWQAARASQAREAEERSKVFDDQPIQRGTKRDEEKPTWTAHIETDHTAPLPDPTSLPDGDD